MKNYKGKYMLEFIIYPLFAYALGVLSSLLFNRERENKRQNDVVVTVTLLDDLVKYTCPKGIKVNVVDEREDFKKKSSYTSDGGC